MQSRRASERPLGADKALGTGKALDRKVALDLRPVSAAVFAVFAVYTAGHAFFLHEPARAPLMLLASITSAAGLAMHLGLRRGSLPAAFAHPLLTCLAFLMTGNVLLHLGLSSDPAESTNLVLLVMAFGAVFLRRGWLLGVIVTAIAGGLAVVHATQAEPNWVQLGFALASASAIAIMLGELRRRTELQLAGHRREEALIRSELEARVDDQTADLRAANESMRRQMEAGLRADELQRGLTLAMDQAGEGIAVLDRAGRIRYANPAMSAMMDQPLDEIVGGSFDRLSRSESDDALLKQIASEAGSGRPWRGRFESVWEDGRRFIRHATITPVRDAEGEPAGYVAVTRDLTREAALEGELQQAKKMEAVGRLAGGIAHDFNNWLTVIRGTCELLEDVRDGKSAAEAVEMISQATDNAISLTRQLLAFSRKQIVQQCALDLNEAVRRVEPMLRRLIPESIEFQVELSDAPGTVWADAGQLEQVVTNLVVNAGDAMPEGGRLTVSTELVAAGACAAIPGLELSGSHWRLAVRDDGVGMDRATREQIFEPFFTTKEPGSGTGLGLSIVYGIAHQCGGDVHVESTPGAGTAVEVYLPWVEAAPLEKAVLQEKPGLGSEPGCVLLVEDEPSLRRLLRRILEEQGHRVVEAGDGAEALDALAKHSQEVDTVLTDVVMPRLGGLALGREIEARWPDLPVLYMTGYPKGEAAGPQELPADAVVLSKPFTSADLARALSRGAASTPPQEPAPAW